MNTLERRRGAILALVFVIQLVAVPAHLAAEHHHHHADAGAHGVGHLDGRHAPCHGDGQHSASDHGVPQLAPTSTTVSSSHHSPALIAAPAAFAMELSAPSRLTESTGARDALATGPPRGPSARGPPTA